MDFGDGAAAVIIGTEDVLAEHLGGASITVDFVDHFRAAGAEIDYAWEERWTRDEGIAKIAPRAVQAALSKGGLTAADVDKIIFPPTLKGVEGALAKLLGTRAAEEAGQIAGQVGETGGGEGLLRRGR